MANYSKTLTINSTGSASVSQNVVVGDTITVTVQSAAGYQLTASVINNSESVCSVSSTSVATSGGTFVITANATGSIDITVFLFISKSSSESGTVTGTVSSAPPPSVSLSINYQFSDQSSLGGRFRAGYWEKKHICNWNVGQAGLIHRWYRGATLLRTLTVSTSGGQSTTINDPSASPGTDVQYTLRIFSGTTQVNSVNYNVIYALSPHTGASANSADLIVPQGATSHSVRINGLSSVRTAYRITLSSVSDGGTLGDDTNTVVANTLGYLTPYTTSSNTIQLTNLPAGTGGSTKSYRIWSYRYRTTNGLVGGPENYGENKYYDFDRTFTLTRETPLVTSITDFSPALSVYTENSGTQTVTFNFSITNPGQSTYYWRIFRASGIQEGGGDLLTITGSVSASTASFSTTISSNSTDETGSQGESFYARLYTNSARTQQIGPDSTQFTLYDNDLAFAIGTISPSSTLSSSYTGTVTVQVTNNGQGGLQPNSRIWNITQNKVGYNIVDLPNPGTSETYQIAANALPSVGTSNTYRLEVWNGRVRLPGPEFTISRAANLIAPTDISFSDAGDASPTTTVTVTASGGSGGTLEVSQDNVNWFPNGSSGTLTRGDLYTFYARRVDGGTVSGTYSEDYEVPYLQPVLDVTLTPVNKSVQVDDTFADFILSDASNSDQYRMESQYGDPMAVRTGNGVLRVLDSVQDWPSPGQTVNFVLEGRKPTAAGGNNQFQSTGISGTLSRLNTPNISNVTIAADFSGNLSVDIFNGVETQEAYAVSLISGLSSANVEANSLDVISPYNGDQIVIPFGNLPTAGNTTSYYLYSKRFTAYGGTNTYSQIDSFTVSRSTPVGGGTGNYGIDVYGPNGSTKVFSTLFRANNLQVFAEFSLVAGASQVFTCEDANDSSKVIVSFLTSVTTVSITTTSTNFTLTNTGSSTRSGTVIAVRIG